MWINNVDYFKNRNKLLIDNQSFIETIINKIDWYSRILCLWIMDLLEFKNWVNFKINKEKGIVSYEYILFYCVIDIDYECIISLRKFVEHNKKNIYL
jgi:hypothetical protein